MAEMRERDRLREFCGHYLQSMDPVGAAERCGVADGFAELGKKRVRNRLEKMRGNAECQLKREDAVRRLAVLAFGRANDAVMLALRPREVEPEGLDLSAVSEIKVTDKGGVEVKFVDRVRALETLCSLLESGGDEAEALFEALREAGGADEGEDV